MRLQIHMLQCNAPVEARGDTVAITWAAVSGSEEQQGGAEQELWRGVFRRRGQARRFWPPLHHDFDADIRIRLRDGSGDELGHFDVAATATSGEHVERLQVRNPAGRQGRYTCINRITGESSDGHPEDADDQCLACDRIQATSGRPVHLPVARDRRGRLTVRARRPCSFVRTYPKHCVYHNGRIKIRAENNRLEDFTQVGGGRRRPGGSGHWTDYLRCQGRTDNGQPSGNPIPASRTDESTWGPRMEATLPVCRVRRVGDETQLYQPGSSETHTWKLYNLYEPADAYSNWLHFVERTILYMPREHLTAANGGTLHTLRFDFKVGNVNFGFNAAVNSGGANWYRGAQEGTPGVCVCYAALNRGWGRRPRSSQSSIDSWYSNSQFLSSRGTRRVIGTIYHEFGHLYTPHYRDGVPDRPRRVRKRDPIWEHFFWALYLHQSYHGQSRGGGEAFSEAYRYRMMGSSMANIHLSASDVTLLQTQVRAIRTRLGIADLENLDLARGSEAYTSAQARYRTVRSALLTENPRRRGQSMAPGQVLRFLISPVRDVRLFQVSTLRPILRLHAMANVGSLVEAELDLLQDMPSLASTQSAALKRQIAASAGQTAWRVTRR